MSFEDSFNDDETNYADIFSEQDTANVNGIINGGEIAKGHLANTNFQGSTVDGIEKKDLADMLITTHSILKELTDVPVFKRAHDFSGLIIDSNNEPKTGPICVCHKPDLVIEGHYIEGCFYEGYIKLFLKPIARNLCIADKSGYLILVLLHELMHASMHVENKNKPPHPYWVFREEALANYLVIKALGSIPEKVDIFPRAQELKSLAIKEFSNQVPDLGYTYFKYMSDSEKKVDAWMEEKKMACKDSPDDETMDKYIHQVREILDGHKEKLQGR